MDTSEEYIVKSEKFLVENETLGEYNSDNGHGSPVDKKTCVHHWLIDPPRGNKSSGTCKLCGEVKKDYFINAMDNTKWDQRPKKRVPRNKKRELEGRRSGLNEISDEDII